VTSATLHVLVTETSLVPRSSPATPKEACLAAATAKIGRMLALASEPVLHEMETTRRRLTAHEAERERTWPSRRRTELDGLIDADIEILCQGFKVLMRRGDAEPGPT
jgi:hypothetical protein